MSIIKCNICEYQIDSDFIDCTEYNGKEVCQECYDEATHADEPYYERENYFEGKGFRKIKLKGNMEKEYLGFGITIKNKKLFTVDKLHGKKYHLYEVVNDTHYKSLAVFKDEESVTTFNDLINKLLTNK